MEPIDYKRLKRDVCSRACALTGQSVGDEAYEAIRWNIFYAVDQGRLHESEIATVTIEDLEAMNSRALPRGRKRLKAKPR